MADRRPRRRGWARAEAPGRREARLSLPSIALLMCAALACGDARGDSDAEAAFESVIAALSTAKADEIWTQLSADTHLVVADAFAALEEMSGLIEQLQPSDQPDARARSGVELLDSIQSPEALFERLLDLSLMPSLEERGRYRTGLRVADVIQVEPTTVIITTRAGQEFEMVLQSDGAWRLREPFRGLLNDAVANLHSNHESLDLAVRLFGRGAQELEELRRYGLIDD